MKQNKMTLEKLEKVISAGFANFAKMSTKEDLKRFATKEEINEKIEELARAVKTGFDETATKGELKEGLRELANDMSLNFAEVNQHLVNIESVVKGEHGARFEKVESNVRLIKTKLNMR